MPSDSAPIEMRPPARVLRNCLKPSPSWPSRFSRGTKQSSKTSSTVSELRRPILFSFFPTRKPGAPFSTMNAQMPRVPASRFTRAVNTHTSATEPLVM